MQKLRLSIFTLFLLVLYQFGCTQNKIDYSIESNIMNPDTLRGDKKIVFNHFLKWTHKEITQIKPEKIKEEFQKIGISTKENDRFLDAYYFFKLEMTYHKKSVENWQEFKYLATPKNKSKKHSK